MNTTLIIIPTIDPKITEQAVASIRQPLVDVHVIRNDLTDDPKDLTGAWNIGMRMARDKGYTNVIISNDDVIYGADWYEQFLTSLEKYDVVGCISNAPGGNDWYKPQNIRTYFPEYNASDNLDDIDKIAKSISGNAIDAEKINGFWFGGLTEKFWENSYDEDNVFSTDPAVKFLGGEDEYDSRFKGTFGICLGFVFHYKAYSRGANDISAQVSSGFYRGTNTCCLYTASFGGYDDFVVPPNLDVPYFVFSDIPKPDHITHDLIRWIQEERPDDPRMRARQIKTLATQEILNNYDYSIWCDSNCVMQTTADYVIAAEVDEENDFYSHKHSTRCCIFEELDQCEKFDFINKQCADRMREFLIEENMPVAIGLFETAFFITRNNDKMLRVRNMWYNMIQMCIRDQCSLTYCLFTEDCGSKCLKPDTYCNLVPHNTKRYRITTGTCPAWNKDNGDIHGRW